jgi:hypothetical protein
MVEAPSSDRLVQVKRKGLDSFRGITAAVGLKWIAFQFGTHFMAVSGRPPN